MSRKRKAIEKGGGKGRRGKEEEKENNMERKISEKRNRSK